MSKLIYGPDDKPQKPLETTFIAIQHVLSMLGGVIVVPMLLAPILGLNVQDSGLLISAALITSGLATILQVTIGSRLPIVQGISFVFLGTFISIIVYLKSSMPEVTPQIFMQYILGAVILGAIAEMLIGYTGLAGKIKKYFTPVVIGPVIFLIGIALFEFGAPQAGLYWPISLLVILLIIVLTHIAGQKNNFYRMYSILIAIATAYGICALFTGTGIFEKGHPCFIDLSPIYAAPVVQNPFKFILPWGMPKFSVIFFMTIMVGYIISIIETIGDYYSCSYFCDLGDPDRKTISRGIGVEGLGCLISGIMGSFPNTAYAQNIAIIGFTKIASRFIIIIAGSILIILGLFSKLGVLIANIPVPIMGAIYCVLFSMIVGIGLTQINKVDTSKDRNVFIFGFAIFMGLSLSAYIKGVHQDTSLLTPDVFSGWAYPPHPVIWPTYQHLADVVNSIGKNSMAIAAIIAIVLDNILPGKTEVEDVTDIQKSE